MEIRKNKLQALIGAIKNLYTIIQSKLRLLTCWQQAVGKTDCVDDVCCSRKFNYNYIASDIIERWFTFHELIPIDSEIYLELNRYVLSRKMHSRTRKFITTDIKLKIVDEIERILMTDLENYDKVKYVVDRLRERINS